MLSQYGSLRVQKIVAIAKMPRSSVYESLEALLEIGLVEEIIEDNFKLFRAYPISILRHRFQEKAIELEKLTDNLDHLEKSLSNLSVSAKPTAGVRYYKGVAGARQIFWNSIKAKNTLYVYSTWGRGRYVGIKFYKNFVAESYARNIDEKVIINPSHHALESIRQYTGTPVSRTKLETIRAVNKDVIGIKGETLMYDNVFAQVYLKDEQIHGFEIESKDFVFTQRSIFETFWKDAEPITNLL